MATPVTFIKGINPWRCREASRNEAVKVLMAAAWRPNNPRQHHLPVPHTKLPATAVETEKTNHPPMCLSTTDAICRRRAPSRRQVHCAPPFDCQPDCVCFHARTATRPPRLGSFSKKKRKKKRKGKEKRKRKKERKIRKKSPFPPGFPTEFLSLRSRLVVENRRRRMWCCKRLDSSDWPVTTIVRGNASFLHVANFFDTSSRTRHCPSRGGFSPPLFSFFLDFHLLFFLILSAQINLFDPRCYGIFADRPVQFFMIFGSNVFFFAPLLSFRFCQSRYRVVWRSFSRTLQLLRCFYAVAIIVPFGQSRVSRISSRKVYAHFVGRWAILLIAYTIR